MTVFDQFAASQTNEPRYFTTGIHPVHAGEGDRKDCLIRSLADYVMVPDADLIIVPWVAEEHGIQAKAAAAAREAFAHAMLVTLVKTNDGPDIPVISVGFRKGDVIEWHNHLQPWMGLAFDSLWLVPTEPEDNAATFRLLDGCLIEAAPDPWPLEDHRDLGLEMVREIVSDLMRRR